MFDNFEIRRSQFLPNFMSVAIFQSNYQDFHPKFGKFDFRNSTNFTIKFVKMLSFFAKVGQNVYHVLSR